VNEDPDPKNLRAALLAKLNGYRVSALLHAAVSLGVPELLSTAPRTVADMACDAGAHEPSLARILRGLAMIDVVSVDNDGRFRLTAKGQLLRRGVDGSLHSLALLVGREYMPAWAALPATARSRQTSFDTVFGMPVWQWRKENPELNEAFNEWMLSLSMDIAAAVLGAYDFSTIKTLVDVGGGYGTLMAEILKAYPNIEGTLFDRAHVIERACAFLSAEGVMSRCQIVAGDFFENIPPDADVYVLLRIVHDWNDERAGVILSNCRNAMRPASILLVIECTIELADPSVVMADLHMLAVTGGEERSEAELKALLCASGFRVKRVLSTDSPYKIFEAVPQCSGGE